MAKGRTLMIGLLLVVLLKKEKSGETDTGYSGGGRKVTYHMTGETLENMGKLQRVDKVGFLYLRYVADPKTLWTWYEPYIKDDEEISPGSNGRTSTMGVYLRDLLLGMYYFDTLFPRIPVSNLEKMNLPTKPSGSTGDMTRGSEDTARRPP